MISRTDYGEQARTEKQGQSDQNEETIVRTSTDGIARKNWLEGRDNRTEAPKRIRYESVFFSPLESHTVCR